MKNTPAWERKMSLLNLQLVEIKTNGQVSMSDGRGLVKSFIHQLLKQQKQELVEKIEGMKKNVYAIGDIGDSNDHNTYYDLALDDVIKIIKKI